MKKFKRTISLLLGIAMLIGCFSTTVFAAEADVTSNSESMVYDFEIDTSDTDSIAAIASTIDQTFTMTSYHKGANRTYSGSKLRFTITITDSNGNPANNIVAVRLCDPNRANYLAEYQFWADGSTTVKQEIPIEAGRTYYFEYLLAYGTATNLKIHMIIESY